MNFKHLISLVKDGYYICHMSYSPSSWCSSCPIYRECVVSQDQSKEKRVELAKRKIREIIEGVIT